MLVALLMILSVRFGAATLSQYFPLATDTNIYIILMGNKITCL